VNYAIFRELCDRMRFEVDCAKSHHRVISEGLSTGIMPAAQSVQLSTTKCFLLLCALDTIKGSSVVSLVQASYMYTFHVVFYMY